jgi:hypothetical protein
MHIHIRIPRHPLAQHTLMGSLDELGVPRMTSRGGVSWVSMPVGHTKPALDRALAALVKINELLMDAWSVNGLRVPSVYDCARAGLKYKPEPTGREWWQTWIDNAEELEGDCEDLASHQAAWYRHNGMPARATCRRTGKRVYHAIVEHPGGVVEDPSLPLGLAEWRARRAALRARKANDGSTQA